MVLPSGNVTHPSNLELQQIDFDVGDFSLLEDLGICDEVTPVDVENEVDAALAEMFHETNVTVVGDPGPGAVE